jgi:DNA-binding CsgD family transcriptional regulator
MSLARRLGAPTVLGIALRSAGLLAEGADVVTKLDQAVDVLEPSQARLEFAVALIELGSAKRRLGNRAEARGPLRHGMDLAHCCGAEPLVQQAHTELAAAGARPRRPMRSGADALPPSERRVAQMAASGLTNRDIAQALVVTPKTVEWHLGQTYRKLNVSSRRQLPCIMSQPNADVGSPRVSQAQ